LVWLALAQRAGGAAAPRVWAERLQLGGDRAAVRSGSVRRALQLLHQAVA
ncbi:MAG: CinA family protein, partial [Burkholderiales bacterium]|nr:CinA family protein [Burkholderiales bacterium]